MSESREVVVALVREIDEGTGKVFDIEGRKVAVFHLEDGFYALENVCPSCEAEVGQAVVIDESVTCPHHGWRIDVVRGVCPMAPDQPMRIFPVRIDADSVLVTIE